MATLKDIRLALAGSLAAIADAQISPEFLDNPTPPSLLVAGVERTEYQRTFGDDATYFMVIEGAVPLAGGDKAAQRAFDKWVAPTGATSVRAALLADKRLTKRWQADGTVLTGQAPLADSLSVVEFRGNRRLRFANGTEHLTGDWLVQIETSS